MFSVRLVVSSIAQHAWVSSARTRAPFSASWVADVLLHGRTPGFSNLEETRRWTHSKDSSEEPIGKSYVLCSGEDTVVTDRKVEVLHKVSFPAEMKDWVVESIENYVFLERWKRQHPNDCPPLQRASELRERERRAVDSCMERSVWVKELEPLGGVEGIGKDVLHSIFSLGVTGMGILFRIDRHLLPLGFSAEGRFIVRKQMCYQLPQNSDEEGPFFWYKFAFAPRIFDPSQREAGCQEEPHCQSTSGADHQPPWWKVDSLSYSEYRRRFPFGVYKGHLLLCLSHPRGSVTSCITPVPL